MHKVYERIEQIAGNVIVVEAEGVANRELAQVTTPQGTSLAQVIRLDGKRVYLQVFAGSRGIRTDDPGALPRPADGGLLLRPPAGPHLHRQRANAARSKAPC
jgi:hypothetical protein